MKLYGANSKAELLGSLNKIFAQQSFDVLKQELIAMEKAENILRQKISTLISGEPSIWLMRQSPEKSGLKAAF